MEISTLEENNELLQEEIFKIEKIIQNMKVILESIGEYDTETMNEFIKAGFKLIEVKIYFKRLTDEIKEK